MGADHYKPRAGRGGSFDKVRINDQDGREGYLFDKITTVSGINKNLVESDRYYRVELDASPLALDITNLESRTAVLEAADVTLDASKVTQTTGVGHYYANGTSGDDANDGLSEATPKKTLQAVFDLVPYLVKHNTCVHLAGTFTDTTELTKLVATSSCQLLIDGGTDLTVVADNAGSPWTADIHSTTSLGLTTAGWVTDAYAGYILEVVDGVCAGQHRMIQGNTADTITPCRNFSTDPGTCSFRISRPSTTLSPTAGTFKVGQAGQHNGIVLQSLYVTTNIVLWYQAGYPVSFSHVVINTSSAIALNLSAGRAFTLSGKYNTTTFAFESTPAFSAAGLSVIGSTSTGISMIGGTTLVLSASYCTKVTASQSNRVSIGSGSRVASCSFYGLLAASASVISNATGYAATRLGGAGGGVSLVGSELRVGAGVDISSCTSHGIECNHSRLHLDGAVTGTGNGGAAVYAHNGSVVNIKNGAPPTISGTLGHLSTDGTTNATWWSTLDAGTPLAVLAEMTMAKEVP